MGTGRVSCYNSYQTWFSSSLCSCIYMYNGRIQKLKTFLTFDRIKTLSFSDTRFVWIIPVFFSLPWTATSASNVHAIITLHYTCTSCTLGGKKGLMVTALVSRLSGLGWSPGQGHCVVFLGKTLYSHSIPANFFWNIGMRFLSWECWDFWKRHDHFRIFRRSPKSSEDVSLRRKRKQPSHFPSPSLRTRINVSSLRCFSLQKERDRKEDIVIYSLYTWFSFLTWVWVHIFLEIVSSKTATTHIFQSGMRNWSASVSQREIEVFNPQAWDSHLRRESWQVYHSTSLHPG